MNEQQQMLADMAGGLFAELGPGATMARDWAAIDNVALTSLLLPEHAGGFGGSWQDALIVFRLAGYHALALPVVEAAIAAGVTASTEGRGTIAQHAEGALQNGRFTGHVRGAAFTRGAAFLLAPAPGGGTLQLDIADAERETAANIAGEARDTLHFVDAPARLEKTDVMALGALARTAQIAGALDGALALSVAYVNERQQFGRPLSKFQAVQQSLATFACEAAAANCAAVGAAQAVDSGDQYAYAIAAAKLRANRTVDAGTGIAHQVHGAIGFTQDHALHHLTRRLWAWRSEFGGDSHWSALLGAHVVARGADRLWADMVDTGG